jgi:FixJ family two-component response regulator
MKTALLRRLKRLEEIRTVEGCRRLNCRSGVFERLANKEIAVRLGDTEGSVKSSLQQMFQKTPVSTRSQLVRMALEGSLGMPGKS